ncbi:MAG: DUF2147 domain-containing protein [Chitinophagaceae bacterium]
MKTSFRTIISLCMLLVYLCRPESLFAQDRVEGNWTDAKQEAKINIYKSTDNKFYGKITWLKEPLRNGKPKLDEHNPDKELKNRPIIGLLILKGFEKDGDKGYDEGTIYDPKNGKTYSCEMTLKNNTLNIRGYIGISLIGRTTVWTRTN